MNVRAIILSLGHMLIMVSIVLIMPRFTISNDPELKDYLLVGLIMVLAFFRSNFLSLNYLFNDYNQKIVFNNKNFTVYKGKKKEVIGYNEIKKCYFIEPSYVDGNFVQLQYFNYCCFLLKNGNRIFVTSLSFPVGKTLRKNRIQYSHEKMFIPYLDKRIGELLFEKK
ncbi:hypothetical protein EO244_16595 [Ancylomarina salipaludis]|uniref:PH domain-containing protein n=1 Tax=Ancylomarina salipaludis TaxID=2501299 RepID=A0A4Q1JIP9_9BACT|nr:hypothetical protein [Ancylomarina salipaludis]RXQ87259.1 hypothetical protein EO244_16595 [Ancylomarina salipaludis]